jgi:hypothetical protein
VSRSTVLAWARDGLLEKLPMRKVLILRRSVERMVGGYDAADGIDREAADRLGEALR